MADAPPAANQFWLLTGEVPTGPFTIAQIHAMLASGKATWQTSASPLGEGTWRPILQIPGIGPGTETTDRSEPVSSPRAPIAVPRPETPPAYPSPAPSVTPATSPGVEAAVGFAAVVVLGLLGWLAYEWFRPLTATEVCKKLDTIQTPSEAKKYVTPRMYAVIETMLADSAPSDPNDTFEWTHEVDGPLPNTKRVGFRGSWYVPEAGKRVNVQGYCKVVMSDGWKVDDIMFTQVEGATPPVPISMADEVLKSKPSANQAKPATDANRERRNRNTLAGLAIAGWTLLKGGGLKVVGVIALGVIGAIAAAWRSRRVV
jgi:hypothetical protein